MIAAAGAEQPAVLARWWVAVPYMPVIDDSREQLRALAAGARGRTLWETHCEAALESQRLTDQVDAALRRAGIDTWPLDGTQALALLWERLHPAADEAPATSTSSPTRARSRPPPTPSRRSEDRHGILEAIAGRGRARPVGEHPAWIRHGDGTLEETIHLATPPLATDPSWLAHLLTCPLPATLAVHISVGVRSREKSRQRRRWQRLRAAVRYKDRRDRLVGSDEEDALEEAAIVDAELAGQIGATVYDVGVYCSIRAPHGDPESFERTVKQICADFHGADQRQGRPRPAPRARRVHLHAAARRRPAQRAPALRAAQHRALRPVDLEPVRLPRRADPRHRRPRRHAGAPRPL